MTDILADPLERLLIDECPPGRVRKILAGEPAGPLWTELAGLGYMSALAGEIDGGAGLKLNEVGTSLVVAGRRLCPVALGETMIANALVSAAGLAIAEGPILLVTPVESSDGALVAQAVPLALTARHTLVDLGDRLMFCAIEDAIVEPASPGRTLSATLRWPSLPDNRAELDRPLGGLRPTAAAIRAATIAGMAIGILETTIEYAAMRRQFGRAIGDFQAIQHQLALMAEETAAASMAASMGLSDPGIVAIETKAAVAKMRASQAARRITGIAHAIHGAIGISAEHDLQLFTLRLAEERIADGGESYWAERIGTARLASDNESSVAFVRECMAC